jgi:hypothetical protein
MTACVLRLGVPLVLPPVLYPLAISTFLYFRRVRQPAALTAFALPHDGALAYYRYGLS